MENVKIAVPGWLSGFQNRFTMTRLDDLVRVRCPCCGLATTFDLTKPIKSHYWKRKLAAHADACAKLVAEEEAEEPTEQPTAS